MSIPSEENLQLTPYQKIFEIEWFLTPSHTGYIMVLDQILTGDFDRERMNESCIRCVNAFLLMSSNVAVEGDSAYWLERTPVPPNFPLLSYHPQELEIDEMEALISRPFDLQADQLMEFHAIRLSDNRVR